MNTIYEYYKGWLEYINYYVPSDYIIIGALFVIFTLALVLLLIKTLSFDADVFFASKTTIRYLKKNPTLEDDKLDGLSRKIRRFPFAVRNAWDSFVKSCSNKPSAYLGQGLIFRESLFDKFLNVLLRAVTFVAVILVFAYSLVSTGELAVNLIKPLIVLIGGVLIVTFVEAYSYILKRGGYYSYAKMLRMLNVAYTLRFEKAIDKAISDLESEENEAAAFKEALRKNERDILKKNAKTATALGFVGGGGESINLSAAEQINAKTSSQTSGAISNCDFIADVNNEAVKSLCEVTQEGMKSQDEVSEGILKEKNASADREIVKEKVELVQRLPVSDPSWAEKSCHHINDIASSSQNIIDNLVNEIVG